MSGVTVSEGEGTHGAQTRAAQTQTHLIRLLLERSCQESSDKKCSSSPSAPLMRSTDSGSLSLRPGAPEDTGSIVLPASLFIQPLSVHYIFKSLQIPGFSSPLHASYPGRHSVSIWRDPSIQGFLYKIE